MAAKKKFNSQFYNIDYYSTTHIKNMPDDKYIRCQMTGVITKDIITNLENEYAFKYEIPFENDDADILYTASGWFKKGDIEKVKEMLKEKHICLTYEKYQMMFYEIPGGYLYSGWKSGRKTKILPKDLPESYVYIQNYKKHGYINTAGVCDIAYKPCVFHNHAFKDDFLFISYHPDKKFTENQSFDEVCGTCDEYVFGNDIVNVIAGIEKYTESPEMKEKLLRVKARMVEQYNAYVDEMFNIYGRENTKVCSFEELQKT